jgi:hypothetical protein
MAALYATSEARASNAMKLTVSWIEISNLPGFICENKAGKQLNIQINSNSNSIIFFA